MPARESGSSSSGLWQAARCRAVTNPPCSSARSSHCSRCPALCIQIAIRDDACRLQKGRLRAVATRQTRLGHVAHLCDAYGTTLYLQRSQTPMAALDAQACSRAQSCWDGPSS